ncbi:hypothetical protein D3C77_699110 [compost metagenome]
MTSPCAVPDCVFSRAPANSLNQSATITSDAPLHSAICAVSERSGSSHIASATSSAPTPNQRMKNEGTTNSMRISTAPATIQYHH